MFIKDDLMYVLGHIDGSVEVKHSLLDDEFGEVISLYAPQPQHNWTEQYIDRFISIYESKNLPVVPNLIKYMMQELLCDKSEYVNYVIDKYPMYADEMRKWLVLV